jgi:DNA polymerase III epsilon subunit-like protein
MIIFDTETTGLLRPIASRPESQPRITEIYAVKLDDETLEEIDVLESLVNPETKIPQEVVKITGIDDNMVRGAPKWSYLVDQVLDFFDGQRVVAHNLSFDLRMLEFDCARVGKSITWPKGRDLICTVERTEHFYGYRLSLTALHDHCFGKGFPSAHRAKVDVDALVRCVKHLREEIIW